MFIQTRIKFAFLASTTFLMAALAGFTDVIGFVGVNKLFTAHITGNIVVAIAEMINHAPGVATKLISLPLFIVLGMLVTTLIEKYGQTKDLLAIWFIVEGLLLAAFMYFGLDVFPHVSVASTVYIVGAMFGVSAMAIHNTLLRTYMPHFPACTAMTANLTQFVVDFVTYCWGWRLKYNIEKRSQSFSGMKRHGNVLAGFSLGGIFAALGYVFMGFWAVLFAIALLIFMAVRSLEFV